MEQILEIAFSGFWCFVGMITLISLVFGSIGGVLRMLTLLILSLRSKSK